MESQSLTFVCVEWGNYCGRGGEYVERLYRGVQTNLPAGYPFRFICYSDDLRNRVDGVDMHPLPQGIKGWYNKLYLFRPGLFKDNERVVYLDLDTIITGPLDFLTFKGKYGEQVRFAILRDFLKPERYGPGMMMWLGGEWPEIWTQWVDRGCPQDLALGDLTWINSLFAKAGYVPHVLQDIYPNKICSYKVSAKLAIPHNISVVCFHGKPRPHEAEGWVRSHWHGEGER